MPHSAATENGSPSPGTYHAINRPGTDWSTGVTVWDLKSAETWSLNGATGPVAFSPDGRSILAAACQRQTQQPRLRMTPLVTGPAIWRLGDEEPSETLALGKNFQPLDLRSGPHGLPLMAAAFHPAGHHAVTVTSLGAVLVWDLGDSNSPHCVDVLHFNQDSFRSAEARGVLRFDESGKRLTLLKLPAGQYLDKRLTHLVSWSVDIEQGRFDRQSAHQIDVLDASTETQAAAGMSLEKQKKGRLLILTDQTGNRIEFDFDTRRVRTSFSDPNRKRLLMQDDTGGFVLVDAVSGKTQYRLVPGQPPEKAESQNENARP